MRRVVARSAFSGVLLFAGVADAQQQGGQCTTPVTTCDGDSGYYVAPDDHDKIQKQLEPLLKELRTCLDAAGGKHVQPAIVIRFDSDGKPVSSKVEAGGYETLPCVASVTGKLVNARSIRETAVRCDYGCAKPKPPPPPLTPTPVVVPPAPSTSATQPPPVQPGQPAQPPPPPPPVTRKKVEKVWYGWQTLAADAVSGTFLVAGVASKTSALTTIGIVGYGLGAPTVHWVHGNIGPGFGSLGMRILLPPIGFVIGLIAGAIAGAGKPNNSLDEVGSALWTGAIVGTVGGMLIPVAIDAAALGYEKVETETTAKAKKPLPLFSVTPQLSVGQGRGTMGLGGTF